MTAQSKVRKFMNLFCITIFSKLFWSSFGALFFSYSIEKFICYLWYSNWFKNETSLTLEANSEALYTLYTYLEPCQTAKMEFFAKTVNGFYYFCKRLHLRCLARFWVHLWVGTCGKNHISDVCEFVFVAVIMCAR